MLLIAYFLPDFLGFVLVAVLYFLYRCIRTK
jgi:hypothetical protein